MMNIMTFLQKQETYIDRIYRNKKRFLSKKRSTVVLVPAGPPFGSLRNAQYKGISRKACSAPLIGTFASDSTADLDFWKFLGSMESTTKTWIFWNIMEKIESMESTTTKTKY